MTESPGRTQHPNESSRRHTPYNLLYDGINLEENIGSKGKRFVISRSYLFGTQELSEYSQAKRRQVLAEFEIDGRDYMLKNPVIVLSNSFANGIQLIIIDGHHRVRYAPKFEITDIPCLIIDAETLTSVINEEKGTTLTPEQFLLETQQNVANALESFDKRIVNYRPPQFLFGVNTVNELSKRFPTF
ncbi:MAG TPA: hypothetical protein VFD45_03755 [Patescibacteria group bacterium]|nr:hypothetical protein [Patescibacteria group bacterium]